MGKIFIFLASFILSFALAGPSAFASVNPTRAQNATAAPNSAVQLFARAQIEAAAGNNESAREHLVRALALDPANIDMLKLLGDVEYRLQHYAAAEAAYKSVLAVQPNNKEVHNRLGGVYAAEDRFNDAVSEFHKSLPSMAAVGNLIELYADEGRLGELEAEYQLELTHDQVDPDNHYNLGWVLEREAKYAEAVSQYQQAIAAQPRFTDAYNALGKTYGDMGRYNDAIKQYQIALSQDPNYYMAMMNWGVELIYLHDYKGAVEKIQKSIEMAPQFALAYENLGIVYDYMNDFTRAVELYQRAITIDPRARGAYYNLGSTYLEHNLLNLAEAAFIKGLSIYPRNVELHYGLGYVYQLQHKYERAAEHFRAAVAGSPNYSDARQRLAEVEAQLNKH